MRSGMLGMMAMLGAFAGGAHLLGPSDGRTLKPAPSKPAPPSEPNAKMLAAAAKRERKGKKLQAQIASGALKAAAPRPPKNASLAIPEQPLRFLCRASGCATREAVAIVIPGQENPKQPFGLPELATALRGDWDLGDWDLVHTGDPMANTWEVVCPTCARGREPFRSALPTQDRIHFRCAGDACTNAADALLPQGVSFDTISRTLRTQGWLLAVGGTADTRFWDVMCPACARVIVERMIAASDDPGIRARLEGLLVPEAVPST